MKNFHWLFLFLSAPSILLGWGELGHHTIGKVAARSLVDHPALSQKLNPGLDPLRRKQFIEIFGDRPIQLGHVSNIPDTHWRNLDGNLEAVGKKLGDSTHFFDAEWVVSTPEEFFTKKLPIDYSKAKLTFEQKDPGLRFFFVGTIPWRTGQFSSLYSMAMSKYPDVLKDPFSEEEQNMGTKRAIEKRCSAMAKDLSPHPTLRAIAYAGFLSHMVGDASQPLHVTEDADGVQVSQRGIHSYFEGDLVDALESNSLYEKVLNKTRILLQEPSTGILGHLKEKAKQLTSENDPLFETAYTLALISNSFGSIEKVRQLDRTYAVATLKEAVERPLCPQSPLISKAKTNCDQSAEKEKCYRTTKLLSSSDPKVYEKACRRQPEDRVNFDGSPVEGEGLQNGAVKSVALWHEALIVERLALASAVLADIWVRQWLQSTMPYLCHTWKYAHKPSFVSPADPACFGYAVQEDPKHFIVGQKDEPKPQTPPPAGPSALELFPSAGEFSRCVNL